MQPYLPLATKDKQRYLLGYDWEQENAPYHSLDVSFELYYDNYRSKTRVGVCEKRYLLTNRVTYSLYTRVSLDGENHFSVYDFTFEGAEKTSLCTITEDFILVLYRYDKNGKVCPKLYWYVDMVSQTIIAKKKGDMYQVIEQLPSRGFNKKLKSFQKRLENPELYPNPYYESIIWELKQDF